MPLIDRPANNASCMRINGVEPIMIIATTISTRPVSIFDLYFFIILFVCLYTLSKAFGFCFHFFYSAWMLSLSGA